MYNWRQKWMNYITKYMTQNFGSIYKNTNLLQFTLKNHKHCIENKDLYFMPHRCYRNSWVENWLHILKSWLKNRCYQQKELSNLINVQSNATEFLVFFHQAIQFHMHRLHLNKATPIGNWWCLSFPYWLWAGIQP